MGPEEQKHRAAERLGDPSAPIQRQLSELAERLSLTIVAGGFAEQSDDPSRPYNSCAVYGPGGDLIASYRKIHLFDVDLADGTSLRESNGTTPGSDPVVVEIDGFKVGLSICYDLRFPELYRKLVDRGADVIVVPAAFTLHTGRDHWHVLLRARAIESQCYVVRRRPVGQTPPRPHDVRPFASSRPLGDRRRRLTRSSRHRHRRHRPRNHRASPRVRAVPDPSQALSSGGTVGGVAGTSAGFSRHGRQAAATGAKGRIGVGEPLRPARASGSAPRCARRGPFAP